MVTLYTSGKQVEITYTNGDTAPFDHIMGIGYRPGKLIIVWDDCSMKQVDNPADIYKHIACNGCFDLDIE